jgi:hypothetical protein
MPEGSAITEYQALYAAEDREETLKLPPKGGGFNPPKVRQQNIRHYYD